MTDQLTQAATDYPDELKVVMEAGDYWLSDRGDWMADGNPDTIDDRGIFGASRNGALATGFYATDHDAIVATIRWLMIHDDECDWTRLLSLGRQLWRHGKPVMAHDLTLLERLLIGVRETLENSPSNGG